MNTIATTIHNYACTLTPEKEADIISFYNSLAHTVAENEIAQDQINDELAESFTIHGLFYDLPVRDDSPFYEEDKTEAATFIMTQLHKTHKGSFFIGFSAEDENDIKAFFDFVRPFKKDSYLVSQSDYEDFSIYATDLTNGSTAFINDKDENRFFEAVVDNKTPSPDYTCEFVKDDGIIPTNFRIVKPINKSEINLVVTDYC